MITRAAVVIGVNSTGGLAPLNAAVSGAQAMETWLKKEGFDYVKRIDDGDPKDGGPRPVKVEQVKAAINEILDFQTVRQLVVYFAGHGYLNNQAEIWLLSGAPDDSEEAIALTTSAEFARSCNVPSVMFISDACRSAPQSHRALRVSGSSIFPNRTSNTDVDIDRFFAAQPGDPALEVSADAAREVYYGLFTQTLRDLHSDPEKSLVKEIELDGTKVKIVPCRKLKDVIADRVDDLAQAKSIKLTQRPQLRLESGEDAFLAKAEFSISTEAASANAPDVSMSILPKIKIGDLLSFAAEKLGIPDVRLDHFVAPGPSTWRRPWRDALAYSSIVDDALRTDARFREAIAQVVAADKTDPFETMCGIQLNGSSVAWAAFLGGKAETVAPRRVRLSDNSGNGNAPALAGSVVLQFDDGSGTVIAGLPGYTAAVLVDEGRVVNVSYVPSSNSPRRTNYLWERDRTDRLRAIAAAAARNGVLSICREDARSFADLVRDLKRYDPSLGVYAALAYADVGLGKESQSVQRFMRRDIGVDIFDVALSAGTLTPDPNRTTEPSAYRVVPFCPMLSQVWSYLRPRGVDLPQPLVQIGLHRRPALWSTFDAEGMAMLRRLIEENHEPWLQ